MRLTDLQIKKLKPPKTGQKTYFDDQLSGFGVRISQGGSKSFVVMYGKKRRLKTIGRYPIISLAEARKDALRILGDAAFVYEQAGVHLSKLSFADARMRFLSDAEKRNRAGTVREYSRLLNKHFSFDMPLLAVSRNDIMTVVEKLNKSPSEAQHAFVAIRTMMNWCVKHGLIENSPVPRLTFKTNARERVLSDDELRLVWSRAEEFGYPYGTIVQLLILTGQRRGEIANLQWNWINESSITFPAAITKNKRTHKIPLGKMACEIIAPIPKTDAYLFPSKTKDNAPYNGWSKSKLRFDEPLDIAPYTLHDLRRTYSSYLARAGVPIHVTERLLNHVSGTVSGVAAVYNRYDYWEEMKQAVSIEFTKSILSL